MREVKTLYFFNPEHDLCLANGDPNFVPPASAIVFAKKRKAIMSVLYGEDAAITTADECRQWHIDNPDIEVRQVVPWGWDPRSKNMLAKAGLQPLVHPLPDDEYIAKIRQFQHRTSILSLQDHAWKTTTAEEVAQLLSIYENIVLKAPLSGSGRGLRWVSRALSLHDILWINKIASSQGCVIVERRINVANNFAYEYQIGKDGIEQTGLSLFITQSGVYRHNILLPDSKIRQIIGSSSETEERIEHWIGQNLMPWYSGPVGFDMINDSDGNQYICEMNLRHTMGMAAHSYLQKHKDKERELFRPEICF